MALKQIGDVSTKAARAVRDGYAASSRFCMILYVVLGCCTKLNSAFCSSVHIHQVASIVSVFLLMWLRTAMSYQHVNGVTMKEAIRQLYNDGGIPRFYKGLIPALCMMPLSRFGDIFSNEVAREFLSESYPAAVVTMFASSLAASWRIIISPADTIKVIY